MKKNLILISLLFLTTTISLFAQNIELPTEYIRNTLNGDINLPANVEGSPYIDEEFKIGKVTVDTKSFSTPLRYNGYLDLFEIKTVQNEVIALLRRPDLSIQLDDTEYKLTSYIDDNGNRRYGYLKFLYSGDISFLKKEGVIKKDAVKAPNSYSKDKPARLEPIEEYFIKKEGLIAEEVRLKRKDILRIINNKEVTNFVKKNNLKLKKESEIIQTLRFFNTIN